MKQHPQTINMFLSNFPKQSELRNKNHCILTLNFAYKKDQQL